MTCIQFNYAQFVQYYQAFSNASVYPQATLQLYWNRATTYVSDSPVSGGLSYKQRIECLNLMTAHLAYLGNLIAMGQDPGVTVSAGIDKINVGLMPPPATNEWRYWLNTSPYGKQLLSLLEVASVGGVFIGCFPTVNTLRR